VLNTASLKTNPKNADWNRIHLPKNQAPEFNKGAKKVQRTTHIWTE
jgi:hypothetical protein